MDEGPPPPCVVLIMGVAGAGKTTVGRLLAERLRWPFVDADDFHPPGNLAKMRAGIPLTDGDRKPWLDALREQVVRPGGPVVLACSALKAAYRQRLQCPGVDLRVVYLSSTMVALQARLDARSDHFFPPDLLPSQFAALEPPQSALTVNALAAPAALVEEICQHLGPA